MRFVFDIQDPSARKALIPPGSLEPSGVTPGTYTSATVTVNAAGQITAAANGTSETPSEGFFFFDDFLADQPSGNLGWTVGSNGPGAGVVKNTSEITYRNQGIIDIRTGGSATGRGFVRQGISFANPGAGGTLTFETLVKLPNTSGGGNTFFALLGFSDTTTSSQGNNAIFFRVDGAANWTAVSRVANVETAAVDTGIPVAAGDWVKLRVVVNPIEASFFIAPIGVDFSATPDATIAQALLPSAVLGQFFDPILMIQKLVGNALRRVYADYASYSLQLSTVR